MSLLLYLFFHYNYSMNKPFPKNIPIFPLNGIIYFPKTNLPLNIFEKRYLDLVNDSIKLNKLMGMIQSKKEGGDIYNVGCLGKISDFKKNDDGRILINLTGIVRFEIKKEITNSKLYREFEVDYKKFENDLTDEGLDSVDREEINILFENAKNFFIKNNILLNWKEFEKIEQAQQINTLAMIAPISNEEKQKILETITLKDKIKILSSIINFYSYEKPFSRDTIQ
jgi:uncharacterized protein